MHRLLLTLIALLVTPASVHAIQQAPITDGACGDYQALQAAAPEACQTKTNLQGSRLPDIVTINPDGTESRTPNPLVEFDVLDATETESDIPTGTSDLEQWLGRTITGEEITKEMSCDEIIEKVLTTRSPADNHTGIFLRLRTPDDYVPDSLNKLCDDIKDWYNTKSLGRVEVRYSPVPGSTSCANPIPAADIALPTYGPMQVANRIWRWLRPPNFEESEAFAVKQLMAYQEKTAPQYACENEELAMSEALPDVDARFIANHEPSPTSPRRSLSEDGSPPAGEVLAEEFPGAPSPSRCVDGDCPAVKDPDDRICVLDTQALHEIPTFTSTLDIATQPLDTTKWPLDVITSDPALGGGELYYDPEEEGGGSPTFDLPTTANYLFLPFVAGPQELANKLFDTERFGVGQAEDWEYEDVDDEDSRWFGLGHTTAEQSSACRATKAPGDNIDACGEVIVEVGVPPATSRTQPGEVPSEPTPPAETPEPGFSTPACEACTARASSGVSQKLLDLLSEAGSKYNVPANVLLGIMRLESGHRGVGKAVYEFTDAEIEQAITTGDPFCVRNEACAAGPFQFLTDPNEFRGEFTKQFGSNCPTWPGQTRSGDWDIWGKYKDASGSANPHPCNLRDAAYAAAKHVRVKVDYFSQRPNLGSCGQASSSPQTCEAWTGEKARQAFCTYHGNCSLNYCDTARDFISNTCEVQGTSGVVFEREGGIGGEGGIGSTL